MKPVSPATHPTTGLEPTALLPAQPSNRVLVLGLGNDILTDDAIGLRVARALGAAFADEPRVVAVELMEMGLALLDYLVGYREAVLIDSMLTGQCAPGTLRWLDQTQLGPTAGTAPHFLGVGDTLALGQALGLPMPDRVRIAAVEVQDPYSLGTELTPAVAAAVPGIVRQIKDVLYAALGTAVQISGS